MHVNTLDHSESMNHSYNVDPLMTSFSTSAGVEMYTDVFDRSIYFHECTTVQQIESRCLGSFVSRRARTALGI